MTYEELIKKLQETYSTADASSIKDHVAIQFNVTGEGAGALYVEITDGKIDIQPYEYFDRDVLVTTSAANLIAIAEGKLDPVNAYLTGKIKASGDLGKAVLLKEIVPKQPKTRGRKPKKQ